MALKIININNADDALHEKEFENHITKQHSAHRDRVILRTCMDDFEVSGPEGKHLCLVYEPMREPLWIFQTRFVDRKIPLPIAKAYIYFLLVGLNYLHSECKAVHTGECLMHQACPVFHLEFKDLTYLLDLKLGNILINFENESILTDFIQRRQPMQYKVDNESGRHIYRCYNDFGPLDANHIKNMIPKLADFGLAARLDKLCPRNGIAGEQLGIYPIQPDYYRAPEVILGCGWDSKADIWNFGVLVRFYTYSQADPQPDRLFLSSPIFIYNQ